MRKLLCFSISVMFLFNSCFFNKNKSTHGESKDKKENVEYIGHDSLKTSRSDTITNQPVSTKHGAPDQDEIDRIKKEKTKNKK